MSEGDGIIYAAGVMFRAGDKVLFLRRSSEGDMAGHWCFPGGKIENGESAMQAAARESQEEIGKAPVELSEIDSRHMSSVRFTTFETQCQEFVPKLNGEHTEYAWRRIDCAPQPLHPGVAMTLKKVATSTGHDSARVADINGFIEVRNNPISKAGIFPYLGRSIGAPEPDKTYMVYRSEEELNNPETIASFALLPLTDEHPHTLLGDADEGYVAPEEKVIHGTLGEDIKFEDGYLKGSLKIFTNWAKQMLGSGKRELSAGYRCTYDFVNGVVNGCKYDAVQRNIRGNHLALVEQGRMGPDVAVLDSAEKLDHVVITMDSKELEKMAEEAGSGGLTIEQLAEQVAAIMPQVAKMQEILAKLTPLEEAEHGVQLDEEEKKEEEEVIAVGDECKDDEAKGMDAAIKSLKAEVAELKSNAMRAVLKEVSARDKLAERVSQHVGAFDASEMTASEVAAYGVEKLAIPCAKGQEIAALEGYLAAASVRPAVAMDAAKPRSGQVDAYLKGDK